MIGIRWYIFENKKGTNVIIFPSHTYWHIYGDKTTWVSFWQFDFLIEICTKICNCACWLAQYWVCLSAIGPWKIVSIPNFCISRKTNLKRLSIVSKISFHWKSSRWSRNPFSTSAPHPLTCSTDHTASSEKKGPDTETPRKSHCVTLRPSLPLLRSRSRPQLSKTDPPEQNWPKLGSPPLAPAPPTTAQIPHIFQDLGEFVQNGPFFYFYIFFFFF